MNPYRIEHYLTGNGYALSGHRLVLLLCGGDKRKQSADIDQAVDCWKDWQQREPTNEKPTAR